MARKKKYTAFVCPFTHWDRAWYDPFETFRGRLVQHVDGLLKILKRNKTYTAFSYDGQTIPIEDYLEIRPEKRDEIAKYVKQGRIALGPWHVLPDVYLVSGESLVRNLQIGHKIARSFGKVMKAGFIPDPFGHPRTMPSILAGFGIDTYIFSRGATPEAHHAGLVFRWVAPNGDSLMVTRQFWGYASLSWWGVRPGRDASDPNVDVAAAMETLDRVWTHMKMKGAGLNTRTVLLSHGVDHQNAQPATPRLIREANRRLDDIHLVQGTFEDYADALRRENPRLPVITGELHSGYKFQILSGTFSARMWIKQQNFECQRLLENIVEPLDGFAGVLGFAPPSPYIEYGWKTLLKNHPHDDICGCSTDEVHEDNAREFTHARQAAHVSLRNQLLSLAGRLRKTGLLDGSHAVLAFNPEPYPRGMTFRRLIRTSIDRLLETSKTWRVRRADGTLVPSRLIRTDEDYCRDPEQIPHGRNSWLEFFDPAMPAGGYAVYTMEPGKGPSAPAELKAKGATIENKYLKATLKTNGTVDLLEKDTGRFFKGLNLLEDTEDVGDEYDYSPLVKKSKTITAHRAKGKVHGAKVALGHADVSVDLALRLPASINAKRTERSKKLVKVPVSVRITLRAGVRRLEFATTITNTAKDHRLRAHFPTGIRSREVLASSHFDLVPRPDDPTKGTKSHHQPSVETQHMDEFVAIQDRRRGAALTTKGLPEYAAIKGKKGQSLAVTLLRCVGWLSRNDFVARKYRGCGPSAPSPAGQCLDTYTMEYAFMPYTGDVVTSGTARWAREFGIPCGAYTAHTIRDIKRGGRGNLPQVQSWIQVSSPSFVLSAVKRPEKGKGLVIRVYNIGSRRATGTITFFRRITSARLARLDETPLKKIRTKGCDVKLSLKPKEIATLLVVL